MTDRYVQFIGFAHSCGERPAMTVLPTFKSRVAWIRAVVRLPYRHGMAKGLDA